MGIDRIIDRYNVAKPDEKKQVKADFPVNAIASVLAQWDEYLRESSFPQVYTEDMLKARAYSLLRECKSIIPNIIESEVYFVAPSLMKKEHYQYAGLFYTALLEHSKTLIIPKTIPKSGGWGYDLQEGTLINKGVVIDVGKHARGGYFINNGKIQDFADWAKDGVFINNGYVKRFCCCMTAYRNTNPLVINFGDVDGLFFSIDNRPSSMAVAYEKSPEQPFVYHAQKLLVKSRMSNALAKLFMEIQNAKETDLQQLSEEIKKEVAQHDY